MIAITKNNDTAMIHGNQSSMILEPMDLGSEIVDFVVLGSLKKSGGSSLFVTFLCPPLQIIESFEQRCILLFEKIEPSLKCSNEGIFRTESCGVVLGDLSRFRRFISVVACFSAGSGRDSCSEYADDSHDDKACRCDYGDPYRGVDFGEHVPPPLG